MIPLWGIIEMNGALGTYSTVNRMVAIAARNAQH